MVKRPVERLSARDFIRQSWFAALPVSEIFRSRMVISGENAEVLVDGNNKCPTFEHVMERNKKEMKDEQTRYRELLHVSLSQGLARGIIIYW